MKHLLIILISLLLLSSFLTSCEKNEETLYKWETSSGGEWKTMGDKNNNPHYKGEVKREYILFGDYILEGLGSLTSTDGNKYVGEWKDGKQNGQGTFTFSDGGKYEGGWKNGDKHGPGIQTDPNGTLWIGEWGKTKDYDQSFQGTKTYPDGDKYVGEVRRTVRWWDGTYYDKDGNIDSKCVNGRCIKQ